MKSRLLFGIFGILLMALVACAPRPSGPVAPSAPAPASAPAAAPAPAPAPAPVAEPVKPVETPATPAPAAEPAKPAETETEQPVAETEWKSRIPPKQSNLTPVETENKYAGEQGGYVASVDCGVKDGIGTLSVTLQNPTEMTLKVGSRPQVFGGGEEMMALIVNGRHVMEVMKCEGYDAQAGLNPGDKVTCSGTSPVDDRHQWLLIRHGLSALGNPLPNTIQVYSPGKGREQVVFLC